MRALRRRPLPARRAVVPVSRNIFNSLFTLETGQPLVGNSRISLLAPYFLNLHKFSKYIYVRRDLDLLQSVNSKKMSF